jgi:hypothetical protein
MHSSTVAFATPIDFVPEVIELVARAALPLIEALDHPRGINSEKLAAAVHGPLAELCDQPLSPTLELAAHSARRAAMAMVTEPLAYGQLQRAMHEVLVQSGLPAPKEFLAPIRAGRGETDGSTVVDGDDERLVHEAERARR